MWHYTGIALFSGFIQYLVLSTIRIYHEFLHELLPQIAEENRHNIQFDMVHVFIDQRIWRITFLIPVAFLCTFILLPYDLLKAWHWIEQYAERIYGKKSL